MNIALCLIGITLLYLSVFLYETEEQAVQNRLEDAWLVVSSTQDDAIAAHVRFMRQVSTIGGSCLTFLFGDSLTSVRSVVVSAVFSITGGFLLNLLSGFTAAALEPVSTSMLLLEAFTVFAAISAGAVVVVTGRHLKACVLSLSLLYIVRLALLHWAFDAHLTNSDTKVFSFFLDLAMGVTSIPLSVACDFYFVVLTRRTLRYISESESFWKCTVAVAVIFFATIFFIVVPYLFHLAFRILDSLTSIPVVFYWLDVAFTTLIAMNFTVFLPASLFVVLAAIMLAHKIVWPIVARPIYWSQRIGIAKRRQFIGGIGISLIVLSIPSAQDWLKRLLF
ncbi:MAG: hypothetical protein AAGD07_11025 [Planctomycetota bacterium]